MQPTISNHLQPPRFIYHSMRLVHELHWHQETFDWTTAMLFIYDPPTATAGRWNEVRGWHRLSAACQPASLAACAPLQCVLQRGLV